jgi:hypothetical protein
MQPHHPAAPEPAGCDAAVTFWSEKQPATAAVGWLQAGPFSGLVSASPTEHMQSLNAAEGAYG